jgi:hypothetical protein
MAIGTRTSQIIPIVGLVSVARAAGFEINSYWFRGWRAPHLPPAAFFHGFAVIIEPHQSLHILNQFFWIKSNAVLENKLDIFGVRRQSEATTALWILRQLI